MSVLIPSIEPSIIAAGDTLKFTKSFNDYSAADGWTLAYYITALNRQKITITADADPSSPTDFLVDYAPSETNYPPGECQMVGYVSKGDERYQIYSEPVTIKADVANSESVDFRSWAQKALEKVETMLLDRSGRGELSYSINGRSFTAANHEELSAHRDRLRSEIAQERRKRNGGRILARFRSPR